MRRDECMQPVCIFPASTSFIQPLDGSGNINLRLHLKISLIFYMNSSYLEEIIRPTPFQCISHFEVFLTAICRFSLISSNSLLLKLYTFIAQHCVGCLSQHFILFVSSQAVFNSVLVSAFFLRDQTMKSVIFLSSIVLICYFFVQIPSSQTQIFVTIHLVWYHNHPVLYISQCILFLPNTQQNKAEYNGINRNMTTFLLMQTLVFRQEHATCFVHALGYIQPVHDPNQKVELHPSAPAPGCGVSVQQNTFSVFFLLVSYVLLYFLTFCRLFLVRFFCFSFLLFHSRLFFLPISSFRTLFRRQYVSHCCTDPTR